MLSAISSLEEYSQCVETLRVPFSRIENATTAKYAVQWDVARLDMLDKYLSGNKLFKLLPYLVQAKKSGITSLLSFGGMYSNHLHALAAAGRRFGFSTMGVVRGYATQKETETLADLRQWGMTVEFAGKSEYARRHDVDYLQSLQQKYPHAMIIPEGGAGMPGIEGSRLMARVVAKSMSHEPDIVAMSTGTGTGFLGVLTSGELSGKTTICGYSALKNMSALNEVILSGIDTFAGSLPAWSITDNYCFGGFAKMDRQLALFMRNFEIEQSIPLDPVYNAKLCFAIEHQIQQGVIPPGSMIVSLHTGGLQGRRGMENIIENSSDTAHQECR